MTILFILLRPNLTHITLGKGPFLFSTTIDKHKINLFLHRREDMNIPQHNLYYSFHLWENKYTAKVQHLEKKTLDLNVGCPLTFIPVVNFSI